MCSRRLCSLQQLRVWKTPAVLLVIVMVGLVLLFGANFNVVLPLFATDVLHVGATGFGFLSAASAIGALLSALWLAWSTQQPTIRRVLIGTLVFCVLEALFAVSHLYFLSLMLIASIGFAETAFAQLSITMLQTVAPDHLRERIMGACLLFFDGSVPLGYLLTGWSLWGFYRPAHRCVSQPAGRRSRVDVAQTSGEGCSSISTLVSIFHSRLLIEPPPILPILEAVNEMRLPWPPRRQGINRIPGVLQWMCYLKNTCQSETVETYAEHIHYGHHANNLPTRVGNHAGLTRENVGLALTDAAARC